MIVYQHFIECFFKFNYRSHKEVYQVNLEIIKKIIKKCAETIEINSIKHEVKNKYFVYFDKDVRI